VALSGRGEEGGSGRRVGGDGAVGAGTPWGGGVMALPLGAHGGPVAAGGEAAEGDGEEAAEGPGAEERHGGEGDGRAQGCHGNEGWGGGGGPLESGGGEVGGEEE